MRPQLIALFLATATLVIPATVGAAPLPPGKVHAVLAFDTESDLHDDLLKDLANVRGSLLDGMPRDDFVLRELAGKQLTPEALLGAVRTLPVGPEDTLLVFYGGHGGRTPEGAHFLRLAMKRDKPVLRSELIAALKARKTRLAVLLTDCCSNTVKLPKKPPLVMMPAPEEKGGEEMPPLYRSLFLESKGLVDITAATNSVSYGDSESGGIFTRTFCRLLETREWKKFDRDGNGQVTWKEFFEPLRKETETTFKNWSVAMRKRGETIDAREQIPQAFTLTDAFRNQLTKESGAPKPPVDKPSTGKTFSVLTIENHAPRPVEYRYRWEADAEWKKITLAPGGFHKHWVSTSAGKPAPHLQVEVTGSTNPSKLTGTEWSGKGEPEVAGKRFVLRVRKSSPIP